MLEQFCREAIYTRCKEYIPAKTQQLVYLKGHKPPTEQKRKFDGFLQWSDQFTVYPFGMAKTLVKQPSGSPLRMAVGLFSREGAFLCDQMISELFHGDWEEAMEQYGTFNALFGGFTDYFVKKKDAFMEKTKELILEQTGTLPKIRKTPQSHGGVANLLKVLTKTMHEQGSSIRTIAKVQYAICTQAGIYVPDEFIKDVLVAADIAPGIAMTYEEYKEKERNRLREQVERERARK